MRRRISAAKEPGPSRSGLSYCRENAYEGKERAPQERDGGRNAKQRDGRPRGTPNAETDGNKRRGQCAEAGGCAEAHARRHGYGSSGPGHDFAGPFRNNPGRIARTPCPTRLAQTTPETAADAIPKHPRNSPASSEKDSGRRSRKQGSPERPPEQKINPAGEGGDRIIFLILSKTAIPWNTPIT